jgi:hypothetical protein
MVDAAGESAVIWMLRFLSAEGRSCGLNSSVWLPMDRPETSAAVALARKSMAVTCWDLRPFFLWC